MTQNICVADQTSSSRTSAAQAVKKVLPVYLRFALVFLLLSFLVVRTVALAFVPTGSMAPTIQAGDFVIGLRTGVQSQLERGTIICFWSDELERYLTKRIVGLPGDRISFRDGLVYVNGEPLDEPYLPEGTVTERKVPPRLGLDLSCSYGALLRHGGQPRQFL